MTLAWPLALLLLLGAAPIVLAFLRRPPPKKVVVSSLLLMEALAVAPDHRKLPPPRELLALALFLLALAVLTAAVALRPDPPPPGRVVLLDTSASMATAVDGQTRYAAAIDALSESLQATGDGPITLVTTAPAGVVMQDVEAAEPILRFAEERTPAGEDGPTDALLAALCADGAPLLIALTEDAPPADLPCPLFRPALPDADGNRGIIGLTLRPAGAVSLLEAHLEVAAEAPVEVVLTADGIEPTTLTLTPTDGIASRILRLSLPDGGTLTAQLSGEDPFPGDDTASASVPAPEPVAVRLVTSAPDGFLAHALRAYPGVELSIVGPGTPAAESDLLILEAAASTEGAGRVVALAGGLAAVGLSETTALSEPTISPVAPAHPLTRYLDLSGTRVTDAVSFTAPDDSTVLLASDGGPVGALLPDDKTVALGLTLSGSDLALRLDFAHLIANLVDWAATDATPESATGVLSRAQSTARVAPGEEAPVAPERTIDHRLAILLAGLLLAAEWGLQAMESR